MSEYALSRTRSAAIVRSNSVASRPSYLLTRTYSVPDLKPRYKPQWPTYYTTTRTNDYYPYRYYTDNSHYSDYWTDRHRYRPIYQLGYYPRPLYATDYASSKYYYWAYPYSYFTRYRSHLYDYSYPYYRTRYMDPYYDPYIRSSYYTPYRRYLYDNHGHLTRNYWDKRFKDWRRLYTWDSEFRYLPNYYNRPSRQYFAYWS